MIEESAVLKVISIQEENQEPDFDNLENGYY